LEFSVSSNLAISSPLEVVNLKKPESNTKISIKKITKNKTGKLEIIWPICPFLFILLKSS
jgi:hypothetical protein